MSVEGLQARFAARRAAAIALWGPRRALAMRFGCVAGSDGNAGAMSLVCVSRWQLGSQEETRRCCHHMHPSRLAAFTPF
jgi:hypothetical protein